jgi:hypothetical protein
MSEDSYGFLLMLIIPILVYQLFFIPVFIGTTIYLFAFKKYHFIRDFYKIKEYYGDLFIGLFFSIFLCFNIVRLILGGVCLIGMGIEKIGKKIKKWWNNKIEEANEKYRNSKH